MRLIIYVGCTFVYGFVLKISLGGSLELCNNCVVGLSCTYNTTDGTCLCLAGFHGGKCEDNNECHNARRDICGHRGVCHNTIGSHRCECLYGWDGAEHCNTNTTLNPPCMPGWHGYKCDDSYCAPHGYANSTSLTDYICVCDKGWTYNNVSGPCDVDIDECKLPDSCPEHSNCTNTPGSYKCSCLASWENSDCSFYNVCQVQSCSNNRTCGKLGDDSDSSYKCTCLPAATNCTDEEFWSHINSVTPESPATVTTVPTNPTTPFGSYTQIMTATGSTTSTTMAFATSLWPTTAATPTMPTGLISTSDAADDEGVSKTVLIGSIAGGAGLLLLLLIAGLIVYKFYKKAKVGATKDGGKGSEHSKNNGQY